MNIILQMKDHIKGHNNALSDEKLNSMSPIELLRNCHPIYRSDYAMKLYRNEIISLIEAKEFVTPNKTL